MIVIIDYGMGNLGSIGNMCKRIGIDSLVTSDPEVIAVADKLILPGVGAFDQGMTNLEKRGLLPVLAKRVLDQGCPLLGICLGMQLLGESSEEGHKRGLGWIHAATKRFRFDVHNKRLKIPHMGWNEIHPQRPDPIFAGFESPIRFYFVHSFHVECPANNVLATTVHGYSFISMLKQGNIYGAQFHPEKSHRFGMTLLTNFARLG